MGNGKIRACGWSEKNGLGIKGGFNGVKKVGLATRKPPFT